MFLIIPAKNINDFYGYRTSRSMRNQQSWNEANKYANRLMVGFFLTLSIVELPIFMCLDTKIATLTSIGLVVVALIPLIALTEKHLKNKFDK